MTRFLTAFFFLCVCVSLLSPSSIPTLKLTSSNSHLQRQIHEQLGIVIRLDAIPIIHVLTDENLLLHGKGNDRRHQRAQHQEQQAEVQPTHNILHVLSLGALIEIQQAVEDTSADVRHDAHAREQLVAPNLVKCALGKHCKLLGGRCEVLASVKEVDLCVCVCVWVCVFNKLLIELCVVCVCVCVECKIEKMK